MNHNLPVGRRRFLLGTAQAAGMLLLAGCDNLSKSEWFPRLLGNTEGLTRKAQRFLSSRRAMAMKSGSCSGSMRGI